MGDREHLTTITKTYTRLDDCIRAYVHIHGLLLRNKIETSISMKRILNEYHLTIYCNGQDDFDNIIELLGKII